MTSWSRCVRLGPEANRRFQVFLTLTEHFASGVGQGTTAIGRIIELQLHSLYEACLDADARLRDPSVGGIQLSLIVFDVVVERSSVQDWATLLVQKRMRHDDPSEASWSKPWPK